MALNGITNPDHIEAGQMLKIPRARRWSSPPRSPPSTATAEHACDGVPWSRREARP